MLTIYTVTERVATITLNRPEKRNALSVQLIEELQLNFDQANADERVKIIVLKSSGEVFCAGADLAYVQALQNNTYEENLEDSQRLKKLFYTIYNSPKIVVAQVEGAALAGGSGLAFLADFTFATSKATFGYTEVNIGFIPALVSVFLLKKVGESIANYLLLSGKIIDAQQAFQMNLIHGVYAPEDIQVAVDQFVTEMCTKKSTSALQLTKKLIKQVQELSVEEGVERAAELNAYARGTADCKQGIANFLNKQPLIW